MNRLLFKLLPLSILEKLTFWLMNKPGKSLRSLENMSPEVLENLGKRKMFALAKKMERDVPLYKDLYKNDYKSFDDVIARAPEIDKNSYIKKTKDISKICVNGTVQNKTSFFYSSGHSGKHTCWLRSNDEMLFSENVAKVGLEMMIDLSKNKTLVLNCLDLGAWIGGMSFARLVSNNVSIVHPGPHMKHIISIYQELCVHYDQIVFVGYPPFLKLVLNEAREQGISFHNKKIYLLLGGEGFNEYDREYFCKLIEENIDGEKCNVFSAFGASDLGVTGFNETFSSIKIRRMAHSNIKFREKLFGDKYKTPMLFQYNPTQFYIERNNKGELLFSTLYSKTLTPLLRYNLHDLGGVISYNEMCNLLAEFKYDIPIKYPLPFLFIEGRSSGAVNFYGELVYPEYIKEALGAKSDFIDRLTGMFKLVLESDRHGGKDLIVYVELSKHHNYSEVLEKELDIYIRDSLETILSDYKKLKTQYDKVSKIKTRLVNFGYFDDIDKVKHSYS